MGTVASRLSRARERLRRQLERRGCSTSPSALAAALFCEAGTPSSATIAGCTRLAEHLASKGPTAAPIPAQLITMMQGVTGSMRLATLAAKSSIACLGLFLAASGALVLMTPGGLNTIRARSASSRGGVPTPARVANTEASQSPTELTAARLERCLSSARANFAALVRATYDFDFRQEVAELNRMGEPRTISVRNYHGNVYWQNGSVRYDVIGPPLSPQLDEQGHPLEKKSISVIRTKDFVATRDLVPLNELGIHQEKAPETPRAWLDRHPFVLSQLDPWVFFAKSIRVDAPDLQKLSEKPNAIRSAEGPDSIVLRVKRGGDDDAQFELIFDKKADCLPTQFRIGTIRDGRRIPWAENSCEWKKTGDVWFPSHQVEIGYVGKDHKPVKFFDLTIRNLRVNADADVPDSVFDPKTLPRQ